MGQGEMQQFSLVMGLSELKGVKINDNTKKYYTGYVIEERS